jgi:tetratricopeptide (TPR) repeat protein
MSKFEQAMQSVDELVAAQNEQAANDRLTQMLGTPGYTDEELAEALYRRGQIRMSARGYDTWGAISDFEEVMETYPNSDWVTAASSDLAIARGKATSLNFQKEQASSTRTQKFDAMMQLGEHQDAMDYVRQWNLTPNNDAVVALYQIGYLCEGDTLTGRSFSLTEPDGTMRSVRFCDAGK